MLSTVLSSWWMMTTKGIFKQSWNPLEPLKDGPMDVALIEGAKNRLCAFSDYLRLSSQDLNFFSCQNLPSSPKDVLAELKLKAIFDSVYRRVSGESFQQRAFLDFVKVFGPIKGSFGNDF